MSGDQEWFELFFDLVFAVAVGLWSERIASRKEGVAEYVQEIPYLLMIWWIWLGQTVVVARFSDYRPITKIFALVQVVAVGIMASALPNVTPVLRLFPLAFVAGRLALLVEYFGLRNTSAAARSITSVYFVGFGLGASLVAVSAAAPAPARPAVWLLGMAVDFATPWVGRSTLERIPLNDKLVPTRVSAFTSLLLFVSINGIVRGLASGGWTLWTLSTAAVMFVMVVAVWWIYAARVNAINRHPALGAGLPYLYMHFFVVFGVATSSVGVHLAVESAGQLEAASRGTNYVWVGLSLWVLAFVLIRHVVQRHRDRFWYCRFVSALAVIPVVGILGTNKHPRATLTVLLSIVMALLGAELRHGSDDHEGDDSSGSDEERGRDPRPTPEQERTDTVLASDCRSPGLCEAGGRRL